MAASANRRKQDDRNLEILRELISINGNKYCLDCNQRGPTYVNTTIGSFVCSKCSGMLRGLTPPHRVKSISMATFTPEEIELIRARGNDYCRRVWLGLYDGAGGSGSGSGSASCTDEQGVRDFMSDKYEKKRYYLEAAVTSQPMTNGSSSLKSKSKAKSQPSGGGGGAQLISIGQQSPKPSSARSGGGGGGDSSRVARPVNNFPAPLLSGLSSVPPSPSPCPAPAPAPAPAHTPGPPTNNGPPPVPDFPVDFNNAEIYNASQFNNNLSSSFSPQPSMTPTFNAFSFSQPATTTNDRYAALAELDNAFKQQNMKQLEESNNVNVKNPFQSPSAQELFASKNPFSSAAAAWGQPPAPVNPFMPSTVNNGGFTNSNNPFL